MGTSAAQSVSASVENPEKTKVRRPIMAKSLRMAEHIWDALSNIRRCEHNAARPGLTSAGDGLNAHARFIRS